MFEDKDAEVFDTIILNGPIDIVKQKLMFLKDQGKHVDNVYQPYFHYFTTNQTLSFPEFIDWIGNNYSLSGRVVMDITISKILFPVSPLVVRKTLSVHEEFTLNFKEYSEEYIVHYFR